MEVIATSIERVISEIILRPFDESDSIPAITELLHAAYAVFFKLGIRPPTSYQDDNETLAKIKKGQCIIAELNGKIVGTVTYVPAAVTRGSQFLDRPDVASFEQYAVEP